MWPMDAEQILHELLSDPPNPAVLAHALTAEIAETVITRLKAEVDRNWHDDAQRSVWLAECIIQIGEQRSDLNQMALGVMARGDSLKFLGELAAAWADLEQAGELYRQARNEIGWARTCIGRLYLSVDLGRVEESLQEAQEARAIFERHEDHERILRLNLNTAVVYMRLGQQHAALALYEEALSIAYDLGAAGQAYAGMLSINIGYLHFSLGNVQQALDYFQNARQAFWERQEKRGAALAELNIAYIHQARGQYRQALHRLHQVQDMAVESFPWEYASARRMMVECYLALNRYEEAATLAQQVSVDYEKQAITFEQAHTLRYLATALAELGSYETAEEALSQAEVIYSDAGAATWLAHVRLQRGRLALQAGSVETARTLAEGAAATFESTDERAYLAEAMLLKGQALYNEEQLPEAAATAQQVLRIARMTKQPALLYSAHLLLGHIHEILDDNQRAMRHYQAAHLTVERVQRGLTVTLRTGFLEDKLDAIRAQLRLYLESGNLRSAFETLERMKAQVLFSHLTGQDNLRWAAGDHSTNLLIDDLEHLRQEHQVVYQMLHGERLEQALKPAQSHEELLVELGILEKRMRAITERLYLENANTTRHFEQPSLDQIQAALDANERLIAYYNDGWTLWAFVIGRESCTATALPGTPIEVDRLVSRLQFNIDCALAAGPDAPVTANLTRIAIKLCQQLYDLLIAPLSEHLAWEQRLLIVPYGALHYIPFHLLHNGTEHLIQSHEVVILPAAGLRTHQGPQRREGALVLAHSWNQRLGHALSEAEQVRDWFGGSLYVETEATRHILSEAPRQILHIAAHGEYRIDHPELSFIQLADGQLYTDDLWQHDLSYELVTLSACETGRANVASGDELIGLGRGFLYAGAGALIASLWRVSDDSAQEMMAAVYAQLKQGASKARALRGAQAALVTTKPAQHPAFWGAFQLMGDPSPLSTMIESERNEVMHNGPQ